MSVFHDHDDELIERVAAELRAPVRLGPEFDERVLSSLRRRPRAPVFGRFSDWLLRPRHLELSPLGLAAAAALVLVATAVATWEFARRDALPRTPAHALHSEAEPVRVVQFVFVAPGASRVSVVGDFNGWDTRATPMERRATPGIWTVEVPLAVGRHQYAFVVDDTRWAPDPAAPPAVTDDFGTPSSVVTVANGGGA